MYRDPPPPNPGPQCIPSCKKKKYMYSPDLRPDANKLYSVQLYIIVYKIHSEIRGYTYIFLFGGSPVRTHPPTHLVRAGEPLVVEGAAQW